MRQVDAKQSDANESKFACKKVRGKGRENPRKKKEG